MGAGRSLQLRLLVLLSVSLTLVWLAVAVWTWVDARHEVDELMDSHLAQAAAILVVQPLDLDDDAVADAPALHKYSARVAFQVFHEGTLVMRSANAGTEPLSHEIRGFETVRDGGEIWRVFATRGADRDVQVYVGERVDARNDIVWAMLRGMLLPMALALPVLAALLWWAVHRALVPLRALSHTLGQRAPDALNPVAVPDVPTEMQPLVAALNGLLARIERMVQSERRFTADAAHELRTPIAAIRAQAQVALGAGADSAQRDLALQTTLAGCDRAAHLVDQLLALARLETSAAAPTAEVCDLRTLARQVAADLAPSALARGQDLALEADADVACTVAAPAVWLAMLLRNLLDNALRYSPDRARVLVRVARTSEQVVLEVHDSGPGMASADMRRLGERFFRVLGHTQSGSGLGWSIVRRIADVTGAQVTAQSSALLGGLHVQVVWPILRK
ncbi:ATP-binding protein [Rhodoferax saidenbachensis]|uniref:histidine kinase n=1 Tax=Rhodoferax saidenbachensis TaxID=1484693 RepID=A0A1P8K5N2_9BURK|nr:ATP-binding protein [Rhodoferax saidenbachensis]APW41307.1 two-component sensor histidine kinase [Rhodoferax saidenbachensis]